MAGRDRAEIRPQPGRHATCSGRAAAQTEAATRHRGSCARVFTSSFPSGHAALSAITYLTLGALLARTHSFPAIRIYFMSVAVVLTLLVGLSNGEGAEPEFRSGWR